jgi:hypothetical protein
LQSSWMCHCPPKTWCDCCQQSHWRYAYMSICCVVYCHVCSIGHAHLPYCRQCFAIWAFPRVGSCTWKHKFHCRTEKEEKRKRIHVGTFSLLSVMFCNMSISRVEGCAWKHEFHCRREEEEKRNNISQAQIIPILIFLEQKLVFCASEKDSKPLRQRDRRRPDERIASFVITFLTLLCDIATKSPMKLVYR